MAIARDAEDDPLGGGGTWGLPFKLIVLAQGDAANLATPGVGC